jgi:membrane protease YdiL (CAAX protease family)
VIRTNVRAVIWLSITGVLILSSFAQRLDDVKPDKMTFFDWNVPGGALAEFVLLGIPALVLARADRDLLGLRKPTRLGRTTLLAVATVVGTGLLDALVSLFGDPSKEQALLPTHWIHGHTTEFVASVAAIAILVPLAEEGFFRGAGVGLLSRLYSVPGAVVLSGCLFALIHGLVLGFLPLAFLGTMLALMRVTSGSILPGILLHGAYNTLAVLASIHFRFH